MATTTNIPAGLSLRDGDDSVRCDDCGAWAYLTESLRHSRRCDTPELQIGASAEAAPVEPTPAPADDRFATGSAKQRAWAGEIVDRLVSAIPEIPAAVQALSWVHADAREHLAALVVAEVERDVVLADSCALIRRWEFLPRSGDPARLAAFVVERLSPKLGREHEAELRKSAAEKRAARRKGGLR